MPQQLQQRGISWKVYSSPDSNLENIVLTYFKQYWSAGLTSPPYTNAFLPQYPNDFVAACASGNLPQVSWVLAPPVDSEHPSAELLTRPETSGVPAPRGEGAALLSMARR